jgi:Cytochrome P460
MKVVASIASLVSLLAVAAVVVALRSSAPEAQSEVRLSRGQGAPEAVVDEHGEMHVPADYRAIYEFLGTFAVAADQGAGSRELHTVYAIPGTISAYRESGRFPDGTVLIKEVYETSTAPMTTGTVSQARNLKGWFVMVKDSQDRYPGNPLWGHGWGWAWFDAKNRMATTSTDYKKDCLACHVPAQATDWVYTSGYPPLK